MNETYIRNVVEAALLAAGRPLQLNELAQLFDESARPDTAGLRAALESLEADYSSRGIEVKETATGFRIQVRRNLVNEVSRLWPERPPRYSRALLETLALIAYRQPITRAEIEAVRGVAVNPNIIKTVIERNWVRVVGTRDVPGRPELLGTTREFLDYFGLRSLEELPPLAELKAMGEINLQLDLAKPNEPADGEAAAVPETAAVAASADSAAAAEAFAVAEAVGGTSAVAEAAGPEAEVSEDAIAADAGELVEAADAVPSPDAEADSGDVTVEVETLGLVEARIEAFLEPGAEPPADASIESGEFEMDELGVMPTPVDVIEAEFEADELDGAESDDDAADDEELSAGPQSSTELVAAPRGHDD